MMFLFPRWDMSVHWRVPRFCSFPCCFHCLLPKLGQLFMLQVTNSELLVTPKSKGWYPKSRWTYHLRPQEFLSPFFGGLTLKQTEGDLQTAHVIFHAKNGRTGNPRRVSLAAVRSHPTRAVAWNVWICFARSGSVRNGRRIWDMFWIPQPWWFGCNTEFPTKCGDERRLDEDTCKMFSI